MRTLTISVLVFGTTLVASFFVLAFEGGIIADATGGVGSTTPVEWGMLYVGSFAILVGLVGLVATKMRTGNAKNS